MTATRLRAPHRALDQIVAMRPDRVEADALAQGDPIIDDRLFIAARAQALASVDPAKARDPHAAKRQGLHHIGDAIIVDHGHARANLPGDVVAARAAVGEHARAEAVGAVVGQADGLGFVADPDDDHDRAKDLLLGDPHGMIDVAEHRLETRIGSRHEARR
jgi:hypothetical protein